MTTNKQSTYFDILYAHIALNWTKQLHDTARLVSVSKMTIPIRRIGALERMWGRLKRISCFIVKWKSMNIFIYSIFWKHFMLSFVVLKYRKVKSLHQITVSKCEEWGHLPDKGFKSRRTDIVMKMFAVITIDEMYALHLFQKCWWLPFGCVRQFISKHGRSWTVLTRADFHEDGTVHFIFRAGFGVLQLVLTLLWTLEIDVTG